MKLSQGKFKKHEKPYWSSTLKADHTHARHLRRTWISEDRPRGRHHPSYLLYKEAKTQFRRQQRQHIVTNQTKVFDDPNKAADVDYRQFWKLQRKNIDRKSSVYTPLRVNDVCYSNDNVISGFSNHCVGIFSTTVATLPKNMLLACSYTTTRPQPV